jgi:hypothetical protein
MGLVERLLCNYPPDTRNWRRDHSNAGFILDSFNYHFPDRLKMLLLSNRKGDIFEELAIHIALARGFVNLHEFSKLHAKLRSSPYC